MKVWTLERAVFDEHGEERDLFINVFANFEAVKEYVNLFEREENPVWKDCYWAMLKRCTLFDRVSYWQAREREVKG